MEIVYQFYDRDLEKLILGPYNLFIDIIENKLNVKLIVSNQEILIKDPDLMANSIPKVKDLFQLMEEWITNRGELSERDVQSMAMMINKYPVAEVSEFLKKRIKIIQTFDGRSITTKTITQNHYLKSLQVNDITFAIGSAGTGKTYLAVAYALSQLKTGHISKVIITRPVVEAGEKLGFLPGDLKEKIDPYLIPIYDSIKDIYGKEKCEKALEKGSIEIAPLAYMRGRTLDNAIIILDEAQNTTRAQMKMFLTRLGFNSKMIITGDVTQIDLVKSTHSGLLEAQNILKAIDRIGIITFSRDDTMRHPLVAQILSRYEAIDD